MKKVALLSLVEVLFLLVIGITDSFLLTTSRFQTKVSVNMGKTEEINSASLEILRQAVVTKAVDRQKIITSIRQLETKSPKIDAKSVEGKWELIFSSVPGGAAEGYLVGGFFNGYFANKEVVDFFACSLESSLGGFRGSPGTIVSTNPLIIEYVYQVFKIGFLPGQEVPPNVRSYRFIYVDDTIAVARTSTGAAALMKRV